MLARTSILLGATLVVGAACATGSSGASRHRARCALRSSDSAFVGSGPVFRDCAVDREARLVNSRDLRPSFTPDPRTACYMVRLEFVVGTDGAPELGTVRIRSTTSSGYERAVIETLPRWRYQPAEIEGVRVRQIVTVERKMGVVVRVVAAGSGAPSSSSIRDPC